jgi:hypothetical protein
MSYIFKYMMPDQIYRNGEYAGSLEEFMAAHPDYQIVEGQFFEYGQDKFVLINEHGHDVAADAEEYQPLIDAINNLGN